MKKDLSTVLDCSSFRIKPLGVTGLSDTEMPSGKFLKLFTVELFRKVSVL